jgi:iron complex transport system substrate-binding protein
MAVTEEKTVLTRRRFIGLASGSMLGALVLSMPKQALAEQALTRQAVSNSLTLTDSLARNVEAPEVIESVTPSGICAQAMLCTLFPEKLASVALSVSESDIQDYFDAGLSSITDLPETGAAFKGEISDMDMEEIETVLPSIILDVGLPKEGLRTKLDDLQEDAGTPCVFLDISFGMLPDAYRTLGQLLGCRERAEELAVFIEGMYSDIEMRREGVSDTRRVFYAPREFGLCPKKSVSLQADVISFIGGESVTAPYDFENGTIDFDALAAEKPDIIVFDNNEHLESLLFDTKETDDAQPSAIAEQGALFVVAPGLFHNWEGSLLLAQSIGMLWLANFIWPEVYDFDLKKMIKEFYRLFYGYETENGELHKLVGGRSRVGV